MSSPVVPTPTFKYLSLVGPGASSEATLTDDDRAEIGHALAELLLELHWSGALRPRSIESAATPGLDVPLMVPGTGDVVVHLRRAEGTYELSISGGPWDDLLVLREAEGGRLAELHQQYFCSRVEQERRAKERLVRGLQQLMLVKDWGIRHH